MDHPFTASGTIGTEEEFFIIDPDTLRPVDAAEELMEDPPGPLEDHLDTELFGCTIEVQAHISDSIADAQQELRSQRDALQDHAADHGYALVGGGLYPAADSEDLAPTDKPRYNSMRQRLRYPQEQNLTAGMHVHVGVDDPDQAVRICDAIRPHLPMLLGLSAASPFWRGRETGLASTRALLFTDLPNTGIPTRFGDWDSFRSFEQQMLRTDSIADRGELWWDVRPHTGYGTVEVRVMDSQADPDRACGLLRLVHALVQDLAERYEDGCSIEPVRHELLEQDRWQALRHGHDARLIDGDDRDGLRDRAGTLIDRLGLDDDPLVTGLRDGSSAQRQLRAHADGGMDAVLRELRLG